MKKEYWYLLILFVVLAFVFAIAGIIYFRGSDSSDTSISKTFGRDKYSIWIGNSVSEIPKNILISLTKNNDNYSIVDEKDGADIVASNVANDGSKLIYRKYFVPVTNFGSLIDDISLAELTGMFVKKGDADTFVLSGEKEELEDYFGKTIYSNTRGTISEIIDSAKTGGVALVSIENLSPELKILKIGGRDIFDKEHAGFLSKYFVYSGTYINGNQDGVEELSDLLEDMPSSNIEQEKITRLAMTGVTAISRGVETTIRRTGDSIYPARGIMDVLSKMDLTHVDSENPFFKDCPLVETDSLILCGRDTSIASLEAIGTDIVDLTGNHQNDFGPDKNTESIGLLEKAGFEYFGGGKNEEDAKKILYKEVNGTKIAFLGYAYFDSKNGPSYRSLAYKDRPGANYYDEEKLKNDISIAKKNSDIVIVDYQFDESYSYHPLKSQTEVFRDTIESGADIVVGVQSHQPQDIEFYKNGVIFYGLGNLFFDQMWSYGTRQGMIPIFTFNNKKLISIDILTTLLYDYSQPRFTIGEERADLLSQVLP